MFNLLMLLLRNIMFRLSRITVKCVHLTPEVSLKVTVVFTAENEKQSAVTYPNREAS